MNPEIQSLIQQADQAIREERFDDLMEFYTEDAVLVINGEKEAHGKKAIKEAFIQIAAYFQNSLVPTQGKMRMIEAGDTVLVLSQTLLDADNKAESAPCDLCLSPHRWKMALRHRQLLWDRPIGRLINYIQKRGKPLLIQWFPPLYDPLLWLCDRFQLRSPGLISP